MSKVKYDSKRMSVYMEPSLVESLNDYCKERGLTKSAAVERIIRDYLYGYFNRNGDSPCNGVNSDR